MSLFRPTHVEAELVRGVLDARVVDFTDRSSRPEIRGALFRHLILGQAILGVSQPAVPLSGIRVNGCRITGPLDLADFARPGGGLPALMMENCDFEGTFDLTGARVARLSIKDSRFSHLILREAEIEGPFDFSGAGPIGSPPIASIDARDCLFRGQVTGTGAHLVLSPRPRERIKAGDKRYALWLHNADIRGSLVLSDLIAEGGVGIAASHIRGNVWLRGAQVWAGEDDALNAQNARIGGSLVADQGFASVGTVWLLGAHFGNSVQLTSATLQARAGRPPVAEGETAALILEHTTIGTNLSLDGATAEGHMLLEGSRLGGNLNANGLVLSTSGATTELAFAAKDIRVAGNVSLDGAFLRGGVDFSGAEVGGGISLSPAAVIKGDGETVASTALSLANAVIRKCVVLGCGDAAVGAGGMGLSIGCVDPGVAMPGGAVAGRRLSVHISLARGRRDDTELLIDLPVRAEQARLLASGLGGLPGQWRPLGFFAHGQIDITGARIHGDLTAQMCLLDNLTRDGSGICLAADRMRVDGDCRFGELFAAVGTVTLSAAEVGRDLTFRRADFVNPAIEPGSHCAAIYAKDLKIGSNCQFGGTVVFGNVILERLEVTGSLAWGAVSDDAAPHRSGCAGLTVSAGANARQTALLDLGLSEIGTALKPRDLLLDGDVRISLGGARTSQLELRWPSGWGGAHMAIRRGQLDLDGLRYDRVVLDAATTTRGATAWLGCHVRNETGGFSPQPYRQLARVLRTQGDEVGSRRISISERWRTRQPWWLRPFWWAYGFFFGFGFKPAAALTTLLVWVAVGTGFVFTARAVGVLKETVVVSSTVISNDSQEGALHVIPFVASSNSGPKRALLHEIPCTDTALNIGDDIVFAVDMILPFIPLHQESRCEISTGHDAIEEAADVPSVSDGVGAGSEPWPPIWAWRVARAVYTVLGWIIVSLSLVTFAGVVKRTEQGDSE